MPKAIAAATLLLLFVLVPAGCVTEASGPDVTIQRAQALFYQQPDKAVALLELAAEHGSAHAMIALGSYYESGDPFVWSMARTAEPSDTLSQYWYARANEALERDVAEGSGDARLLGIQYASGRGTAVDYGRACDMMMISLERGDRWSWYWAEKYCDKGRLAVELSRLEERGLPIAFAARAHVEYMSDPENADVVRYVALLRRGIAAGDSLAAEELMDVQNAIDVRAQAGEIDAMESVARLRVAGLWDLGQTAM